MRSSSRRSHGVVAAPAAPVAGSGTYVYCLVRSARRPSLARSPRGVPGSRPPRAVGAGASLWLVVADVPMRDFGRESIERGLRDFRFVSENALGHAAVVQSLALSRDVVPMKLFTIFASDERALASVRARRAAVDRAFRAIRGCVEWGVKVEVDSAPAAALAEERGSRSPARSSPGAAFLERKRLVRDAAAGRSRLGRARATETHRALSLASRRSLRRRPPAAANGAAVARPLLDAVYLVPRERAREFRASVGRLGRRMGEEGFRVVLTGPWPPYSFVGDRG